MKKKLLFKKSLLWMCITILSLPSSQYSMAAQREELLKRIQKLGGQAVFAPQASVQAKETEKELRELRARAQVTEQLEQQNEEKETRIEALQKQLNELLSKKNIPGTGPTALTHEQEKAFKDKIAQLTEQITKLGGAVPAQKTRENRPKNDALNEEWIRWLLPSCTKDNATQITEERFAAKDLLALTKQQYREILKSLRIGVSGKQIALDLPSKYNIKPTLSPKQTEKKQSSTNPWLFFSKDDRRQSDYERELADLLNISIEPPLEELKPAPPGGVKAPPPPPGGVKAPPPPPGGVKAPPPPPGEVKAPPEGVKAPPPATNPTLPQPAASAAANLDEWDTAIARWESTDDEDQPAPTGDADANRKALLANIRSGVKLKSVNPMANIPEDIKIVISSILKDEIALLTNNMKLLHNAVANLSTKLTALKDGTKAPAELLVFDEKDAEEMLAIVYTYLSSPTKQTTRLLAISELLKKPDWDKISATIIDKITDKRKGADKTLIGSKILREFLEDHNKIATKEEDLNNAKDLVTKAQACLDSAKEALSAARLEERATGTAEEQIKTATNKLNEATSNHKIKADTADADNDKLTKKKTEISNLILTFIQKIPETKRTSIIKDLPVDRSTPNAAEPFDKLKSIFPTTMTTLVNDILTIKHALAKSNLPQEDMELVYKNGLNTCVNNLFNFFKQDVSNKINTIKRGLDTQTQKEVAKQIDAFSKTLTDFIDNQRSTLFESLTTNDKLYENNFNDTIAQVLNLVRPKSHPEAEVKLRTRASNLIRQSDDVTYQALAADICKYLHEKFGYKLGKAKTYDDNAYKPIRDVIVDLLKTKKFTQTLALLDDYISYALTAGFNAKPFPIGLDLADQQIAAFIALFDDTNKVKAKPKPAAAAAGGEALVGKYNLKKVVFETKPVPKDPAAEQKQSDEQKKAITNAGHIDEAMAGEFIAFIGKRLSEKTLELDTIRNLPLIGASGTADKNIVDAYQGWLKAGYFIDFVKGQHPEFAAELTTENKQTIADFIAKHQERLTDKSKALDGLPETIGKTIDIDDYNLWLTRQKNANNFITTVGFALKQKEMSVLKTPRFMHTVMKSIIVYDDVDDVIRLATDEELPTDLSSNISDTFIDTIVRAYRAVRTEDAFTQFLAATNDGHFKTLSNLKVKGINTKAEAKIDPKRLQSIVWMTEYYYDDKAMLEKLQSSIQFVGSSEPAGSTFFSTYNAFKIASAFIETLSLTDDPNLKLLAPNTLLPGEDNANTIITTMLMRLELEKITEDAKNTLKAQLGGDMDKEATSKAFFDAYTAFKKPNDFVEILPVTEGETLKQLSYQTLTIYTTDVDGNRSKCRANEKDAIIKSILMMEDSEQAKGKLKEHLAEDKKDEASEAFFDAYKTWSAKWDQATAAAAVAP